MHKVSHAEQIDCRAQLFWDSESSSGSNSEGHTFSFTVFGFLIISGAIHGNVPRCEETLLTKVSLFCLDSPKSATLQMARRSLQPNKRLALLRSKCTMFLLCKYSMPCMSITDLNLAPKQILSKQDWSLEHVNLKRALFQFIKLGLYVLFWQLKICSIQEYV